MILLADLSFRPHSLGEEEFVHPIAEIVRTHGQEVQIRHYREVNGRDREEAEAVVLCGTALKDHGYADRLESFRWVGEGSLPCLGICAGMQVLGMLEGGRRMTAEEIGMTEIRRIREDPLLNGHSRFAAYALHRFSVALPASFVVLAVSDRCPQLVRQRGTLRYGTLFHPEVRNEWVVERFLDRVREVGE